MKPQWKDMKINWIGKGIEPLYSQKKYHQNNYIVVKLADKLSRKETSKGM